MAAKKSEQRLRWERWLAYVRTQERVRQRIQKFIYKMDPCAVPLYGSYLNVWPNDEENIQKARANLEVIYLKTKVKFKRVGVSLSPPEWIVKQADLQMGNCYTTVGWKACADKNVGNEAQRKLALRHKRARSVRP